MIILAINTASSRTGIALFESVPGDSTPKLLAKNSWTAHNDEAEKLMPAIARLLKRAGQTFSNIKQIYVIKGPGSFTGLRVGVTVANTLAYLNTERLRSSEPKGEQAERTCDEVAQRKPPSENLKCALFGITTFEYWHSVSDLPIVLYAGSGGVYLSLNASAEPQLIKLDELNDILKKQKIKEISGDISLQQISILKNTEFVKTKKTFGEIMEIIIKKNLGSNCTAIKSVKIITPIYIKKPGITTPKTKKSVI